MDLIQQVCSSAPVRNVLLLSHYTGGLKSATTKHLRIVKGYYYQCATLFSINLQLYAVYAHTDPEN